MRDIVVSLLTHWRRWMLARQSQAVLKAVQSLTPEQRRQAADQTLAEIQAAACLPVPWLHGDNVQLPYQPWSPVASAAIRRVQDRAVQVRQRGIALWLAVVYHETREARDPGLQAVHRATLGILRELKDSRGAAAGNRAWSRAAA